jgi:hypothetical protein
VLAAVGSPALDRVGAAAEPLAPVGLGVVAVGVLGTRLLTAAAPLARWFGDHRALRRLEPLARHLAAAAPEWGISSVADRRTLRDPAGRLYRRVIAVRDASWTLVGLAEDGAVIERAQDFARARAGQAGDEAVAVRAEACWLRYAVEAAARGARPVDADDARFPERVPEPAGSLREEAAFLVAVARMWHDPRVEEFLADPPAHRHPHLRSA